MTLRKPDTQDGYLKLADAWIPTVLNAIISPTEVLMILYMWHRTYGQRLKKDGKWTTIDKIDPNWTDISDDLHINRQVVSRAFRNLIDLCIITYDGMNLYLNRETSMWKCKWRDSTKPVPNRDTIPPMTVQDVPVQTIPSQIGTGQIVPEGGTPSTGKRYNLYRQPVQTVPQNPRREPERARDNWRVVE